MDSTGAIVCALGLLVLSVVIVGLRQLTRSGQVDRNSAVGIRTRATQASDEAWRVGHLAAGPWLLASALCGASLAALSLGWSAVSLLLASPGPGPLVIALGGFVVVVVTLLIATSRANTAARSVGSTPEPNGALPNERNRS